MGFGDIWPTPEIDSFTVTSSPLVFIEKDPTIVFVYLFNLGSGNIYVAHGQDAVPLKGIVLAGGTFITFSRENKNDVWIGDSLSMVTTGGSKAVSAYIVRGP